MKYFYRIKHFEEILGNEIIDINSLRKLAFNGNHILYTNLLINLVFMLAFNYKLNYKHYSILTGIPEDRGLRSLVWKILLHYIPPEKNNWEATIFTKRQIYNQYISKSLKGDI